MQIKDSLYFRQKAKQLYKQYSVKKVIDNSSENGGGNEYGIVSGGNEIYYNNDGDNVSTDKIFSETILRTTPVNNEEYCTYEYF